jgi:hypothetical protein
MQFLSYEMLSSNLASEVLSGIADGGIKV